VKIFSRKIFALEVGLGQEELQGIRDIFFARWFFLFFCIFGVGVPWG
jgi:hypothetical protein